jgi:uncharacterized protein (TIGR00369 family)
MPKDSRKAANPPKVSAEEMNQFFRAHFKGDRGLLPDITHAEADYVVMNAVMGEQNMRPGNMVSGPTQMALADHIAYAVIFTRIGITPMAVTSNLNIDFLRPCMGQSVRIEGRMIKLGRSLAVISTEVYGNENEKIASRATVTYALPQKAG